MQIDAKLSVAHVANLSKSSSISSLRLRMDEKQQNCFSYTQKKDERIYVFYFKQYPMYEKIKNNGTNISPCSTKHINTPIHTPVTQNRPTGEENKTFTLSPI